MATALTDNPELIPLEFASGNEDVRIGESLHQDSAQPVLLADIGEVACIRSRFVEIDGYTRERQTWVIKNNAAINHIRVTTAAVDAVSDSPKGALLHFPGLTEMIDAGTAKELHDEMALAFPEKTIASVNTDGVGKYCTGLGIKEGIAKKFDDMAAARLLIAKHFTTEEGPTDIVAVSMGTTLTLRMADQNADKSPEDRVEIDNVVLVVPAVVDENAAEVMILKFLPHIFVNGPVTAFKHPRTAIKSIGRAITGFRPQTLPALAGNVINLLQGSDPKMVDALPESHNVSVITGSKDPLARLKRWGGLETQYPDKVQLMVFEDEGHALPLDARRTAQAIRQAIDNNTRRSADEPKPFEPQPLAA